MAAPQAALDLTERFGRNLEAYRTEHAKTALQRQIDATDRRGKLSDGRFRRGIS